MTPRKIDVGTNTGQVKNSNENRNQRARMIQVNCQNIRLLLCSLVISSVYLKLILFHPHVIWRCDVVQTCKLMMVGRIEVMSRINVGLVFPFPPYFAKNKNYDHDENDNCCYNATRYTNI